MKLYQQLAAEIADMIRQGRLPPGHRLPSVRQTSSRRRVSPSTVFEAYYLLEAQGLVRARARSGYYVAEPADGDAAPAEPQTAVPSEDSAPVAVSELVFQLIDGMRERQRVPLGSAFPSPALFPLPQLARHVGQAMARLDPWRTVEDLAPGNPRLREQIALRYALAGMPVDQDEIVITNGAMEALTLSLQTVTRAGDVVAIESPTFYAALQALERLGLQAVEVATHPRTGIDLASLRHVLDRHPVRACWFMPNFQNPLGSLMPDAAKQSLVELLAGRDVALVEDDVYGELYFGAQRPLPAKAWDRDGRVLHCGSFAKCLAPGYRIGWVAAGRHAQAIGRAKLMTSLSAPLPSQQAISSYLERGGYERHLRRLRAALAAEQARVLEAIARHFPAGTRVTRPQGGYLLWVELPTAVDALALHARALREGVGLAPGVLFSADRRFRHHLRINCGHPGDARVPQALRTVGAMACGMASATP